MLVLDEMMERWDCGCNCL